MQLPESVYTLSGNTVWEKASQSSRLGSREFNLIVFPATCAAEKLPKARRDAALSRRSRRATPAAMEREYPLKLPKNNVLWQFNILVYQGSSGRPPVLPGGATSWLLNPGPSPARRR